jgi:acyl-CoA dehydrogenase
VSSADDGSAAGSDLFELPSRYRELQAEAGLLAASVAGRAAVADEADGVDPVMRRALRGSGLAEVTVGREYGGRFPRVDSLAVTVVREVLAGVSGHLDSLFARASAASRCPRAVATRCASAGCPPSRRWTRSPPWR